MHSNSSYGKYSIAVFLLEVTCRKKSVSIPVVGWSKSVWRPLLALRFKAPVTQTKKNIKTTKTWNKTKNKLMPSQREIKLMRSWWCSLRNLKPDCALYKLLEPTTKNVSLLKEYYQLLMEIIQKFSKRYDAILCFLDIHSTICYVFTQILIPQYI